MQGHKDHVYDAFLHVDPATNGLHVVVTDSDGYRAHKRFSPSTLLPLRDWLKSPETWVEAERAEIANANALIHYCHETGRLVVRKGDTERRFDPNDEEHLAKFVRYLKGLKPIASADQPPLPHTLPKPTEEQLARRTILSQVGSAGGIPGYKKPRQRYNQPAVSQAKSQELISKALASLLASRVAT